jgi:hypothetical protein
MSARIPIRQLAAYSPVAPHAPRCGVCWSEPALTSAGKARRGWRVQADTVEVAPGELVSVAATTYACRNPACTSAIVVRMALTGGYLASDVEAGLLRDGDAARFNRGRTARDGVWRDRSGDPRTAPMQRELFAV